MARGGRRSESGRIARLGVLAAFSVAVAALAHWAGARAAATAPPDPSLRVTLSALPGLAVAARLVVVAPGARNVVVRYGPEKTVTSFAIPESGTLSTALIGLLPGATSHVEVIAHFVDGTASSSGELTVKTPPVDDDVPATLPVVSDGSASGVVTLSMNRGERERGLAVVVNRRGRVLWYRRCGGGAFDFERLSNGHLILHQIDTQSFEELALDGSVVHTWNDEKSITGSDGHDFKLLDNGDALVFGAESHRVDSRKFFAGGVDGALRWDDTVSELTRAGDVVWRWSSYGHAGEDEITGDASEPVDPKDYEVVHANAIEPLLDGDLLLSFRNLSSVVKIDRGTGRVLFHFGGKRSDFRFVGDALGGFSRQHDARLVGPGRILLFDNGNLHEPKESRAVEYRYDETTKTAVLAWEHRHIPPIFSRISGSVQRLPDGHTLIAWGPRGVVTEVDASSKTVWELTIPNAGFYRARSVPSIYP